MVPSMVPSKDDDDVQDDVHNVIFEPPKRTASDDENEEDKGDVPLEKDELPEALRQDLAEAIREAMRKLPPKEQDFSSSDEELLDNVMKRPRAPPAAPSTQAPADPFSAPAAIPAVARDHGRKVEADDYDESDGDDAGPSAPAPAAVDRPSGGIPPQGPSVPAYPGIPPQANPAPGARPAPRPRVQTEPSRAEPDSGDIDLDRELAAELEGQPTPSLAPRPKPKPETRVPARPIRVLTPGPRALISFVEFDAIKYPDFGQSEFYVDFTFTAKGPRPDSGAPVPVQASLDWEERTRQAVAKTAAASRAAREALAEREARRGGAEDMDGDDESAFLLSGQGLDEADVREIGRGVERLGAELRGDAWFVQRRKRAEEARWREAVESGRLGAEGGVGGEQGAGAGLGDEEWGREAFAPVAMEAWEGVVQLERGARREVLNGVHATTRIAEEEDRDDSDTEVAGGVRAPVGAVSKAEAGALKLSDRALSQAKPHVTFSDGALTVGGAPAMGGATGSVGGDANGAGMGAVGTVGAGEENGVGVVENGAVAKRWLSVPVVPGTLGDADEGAAEAMAKAAAERAATVPAMLRLEPLQPLATTRPFALPTDLPLTAPAPPFRPPSPDPWERHAPLSPTALHTLDTSIAAALSDPSTAWLSPLDAPPPATATAPATAPSALLTDAAWREALGMAPAAVVEQPKPVPYTAFAHRPVPDDPIERDLAPFLALSNDAYADLAPVLGRPRPAHSAVAFATTVAALATVPDAEYQPGRFHHPTRHLCAYAGLREPEPRAGKAGKGDKPGKVTSSLIVLSPYGPSTALRLDDIDVTASLDYLFKRKVQHGRQRFVQGRAIPGVPPFFEAGPKTLFQVWDPRDRSALAPPPAPSSKPSATQPKAGSKPTVTTTTATRTTTTTTNATATTTRATPSRLLTLQPTTLLSHCPSRVLFIVNTLVLPLNSHELAKLPDATSNEPVKPPGAFKRRRDLLARKPGHFIAVEYLEERPPLLQDDGMGARLVTFYQKRDAQDTSHKFLTQGDPRTGKPPPHPRWRVGEVVPVDPPKDKQDSDVPFQGARLDPGDSLLAFETNLFECPACAHEADRDFLLVRQAEGQLLLRELTGTVFVGQEHPREAVPAPGSPDFDELLVRLVRRHIWAELKGPDEERRLRSSGEIPPVELPVSQVLAGLGDRILAAARDPPKKIVERAAAASGLGVQRDVLVLSKEKRVPEEAELNRQFPPELFSLFKSARAGDMWLRSLGVHGDTHLQHYQPSYLEAMRRTIAVLYPGDDRAMRALDALKLYCWLTPWSTTSAFVNARMGAGTVDLSNPAGDPTGKGLGYAFVPHEQALRGAAARFKAGPVAGTEADYRSKSMAQLRELLRKEASLFTRDVPLDIVLQYGRWQMVAFLKEINNLRFEEGDTSKAAHFRLNLKSARQRVEGNAVAARAVFEKQRAALRVAPAGGGGEEGGGEGEGEAGQSGGTSVRTGRKSGVSGKRPAPSGATPSTSTAKGGVDKAAKGAAKGGKDKGGKGGGSGGGKDQRSGKAGDGGGRAKQGGGKSKGGAESGAGKGQEGGKTGGSGGGGGKGAGAGDKSAGDGKGGKGGGAGAGAGGESAGDRLRREEEAELAALESMRKEGLLKDTGVAMVEAEVKRREASAAKVTHRLRRLMRIRETVDGQSRVREEEIIITNPIEIEAIKAFWPDNRKPDPRTGAIRILPWGPDRPGVRPLNPMEMEWQRRGMKEVKAAAAAAKGGGGARGARAAKGGRRAAKAQGSDEEDAARSLSDSSAPSSAPSGESDPEDENADAEGQFHDVRKRKFEERQEAQSRPARQAPIRKARDAGVPRPARDAFNRALLSLLQRVVSDPELSTPVPEYHESLVAGFLSEGLLKSIEDYQSKVPKQDWVLIDSMRRRCVRKADSYTSIAAFLQDWDKMVCNTKKYHDPERGGALRDPFYIRAAERVRARVGEMIDADDEIVRLGREAEEEEQRVAGMTDEQLGELKRQARAQAAVRRREAAEVRHHWAECTRCRKWRVVSQEIAERAERERFVCDNIYRSCKEEDDDKVFQTNPSELVVAGEWDDEVDVGGADNDVDKDDPDADFDDDSDGEFDTKRRAGGGVGTRARKAGGGAGRKGGGGSAGAGGGAGAKGRGKRAAKRPRRYMESYVVSDGEGEETEDEVDVVLDSSGSGSEEGGGESEDVDMDVGGDEDD